MNVLAGWMIMVGLMLAGSSIRDVAEAIEKHGQQCESVAIKP